jgi:hypothetical protein
MMTEWFKRAQRCDNALSERRVWRSRCGRYKVEESNIRYGRETDKQGNYLGYPIIYRAMVKNGDTWSILSTHRKRSAATKQLEYFHENGTTIPKKRKRRRKK